MIGKLSSKRSQWWKKDRSLRQRANRSRSSRRRSAYMVMASTRSSLRKRSAEHSLTQISASGRVVISNAETAEVAEDYVFKTLRILRGLCVKNGRVNAGLKHETEVTP